MLVGASETKARSNVSVSERDFRDYHACDRCGAYALPDPTPLKVSTRDTARDPVEELLR